MTIHGDARSGTLRKDTLVRYLGADPKALSALDPVTGLPPLATAAVAGFPDVVELLLSNGAPVDGLSRDGETALLLTMKEGTRNRALIVQLLLKKKPAVDATSAASGNNTALMYATTKEDLESMRLLVAAGASPTKINNAGLSATQMANATKKGKLTLKGQKEETGVLASLASAVLAVAKYVVSFAQKTTGAVMRFFGWSPKTDKTLDENINDGETPNDEVFLENVDDYVQGTPSLQRFFKDKPDYIQELAKKAVALKNDKSTSLGEPEVLPKTIKVTLHQQVIYCDDSSSMKRDGRWAAQADLVARIARVTTQILPDGDGVALRFINQSADQSENLSFQQLQSTMNNMSWQPNGDTPIGTNLRSKILEPMVYSKLQPATLRRPLLVSVITDGMPSQESNDTLVEVIKECGAKLTAAGYPRDSQEAETTTASVIVVKPELGHDVFGGGDREEARSNTPSVAVVDEDQVINDAIRATATAESAAASGTSVEVAAEGSVPASMKEGGLARRLRRVLLLCCQLQSRAQGAPQLMPGASSAAVEEHAKPPKPAGPLGAAEAEADKAAEELSPDVFIQK